MVSNFFPFATIWTRLIIGRLLGVRLDRWIAIRKRTKKWHDFASNGRVAVVFVDFVKTKKLLKQKLLNSKDSTPKSYFLAPCSISIQCLHLKKAYGESTITLITTKFIN